MKSRTLLKIAITLLISITIMINSFSIQVYANMETAHETDILTTKEVNLVNNFMDSIVERNLTYLKPYKASDYEIELDSNYLYGADYRDYYSINMNKIYFDDRKNIQLHITCLMVESINNCIKVTQKYYEIYLDENFNISNLIDSSSALNYLDATDIERSDVTSFLMDKYEDNISKQKRLEEYWKNGISYFDVKTNSMNTLAKACMNSMLTQELKYIDKYYYGSWLLLLDEREHLKTVTYSKYFKMDYNTYSFEGSGDMGGMIVGGIFVESTKKTLKITERYMDIYGCPYGYQINDIYYAAPNVLKYNNLSKSVQKSIYSFLKQKYGTSTANKLITT